MQRVFPPAARDDIARRDSSFARLDALATLMDAAFVVQGTNIRMGLNGLIGLVPVAGNTIAGAISNYIIWEARQLGAPGWLIARMMLDVAIVPGIGAVPLVGDMFNIPFSCQPAQHGVAEAAQLSTTLLIRSVTVKKCGRARARRARERPWIIVRDGSWVLAPTAGGWIFGSGLGHPPRASSQTCLVSNQPCQPADELLWTIRSP